MAEPDLRRSLFGFSRRSVERLINDRADALARAGNETRRARDRIEELEHEVRNRASLKVRVAELEAVNREMVSDLKAAADRMRDLEQRLAAEAAVPSVPPSPEGIGDVLEATERAVARLLEDAGTIAEKRLRETERAHGELLERSERLAAWRQHVIPLADEIRRQVDEARTQLAEAAQGIRSAAHSAIGAMETIAGRLEELGQTVPPEPAIRKEVIRLEEAEPEDAADPAGGTS